MNTAIQIFGSTGKEKPFPWGNALYMDNVDDSVTIPYSPTMDFTGKSFTVTMWTYKEELAPAWEGMLANWSGVSNAVQHLSYMLGPNGLGANVRIRTGDSTDAQFTQSGSALLGFILDQWTFRVFQFDKEGVNGESGNIRLIDSRINIEPNFPNVTGVSFWSGSTLSGMLNSYSFSDKVWTFNAPIGGFAGSRHNKYVDTVGFFDRALTNVEVLRLYKRGKGYLPTKIPNCVACYLFDEPSGTAIASSAQTPGSPASRIILDQSGNGNHAYATGYGAGSTDFVDHFTLI